MSEAQRLQTAFPVLPLKNAVLFPYLLMPLSVGRESSVAAVHAALETDEKEIILFSQKDPTVENAGPQDLHTIGTRAVIRKMSPNDDNIELLVLGVERVAVIKFEQTEPYLQARVRPLPLPEDKSAELEALQGALMDLAAKA
ncbi:MAG: LON peptidase substrate-binding domain-containing protein, partial [Bryobacteraceae bacterium]